ncbi:MAG: hypothetical protein AB7O24_20930 [Kofleriaceae bacterium]
MRYHVEESPNFLRIRRSRAPGVRRTAIVLVLFIVWYTGAYLVISRVLPDEWPLWAIPVLFCPPLLAMPTFAGAVSSAIWPDQRRFIKAGNAVVIGKTSFEREHLHQLTLEHDSRGKTTLSLRMQVKELKVDLVLAELSDRAEATALATRVAKFLELPVVGADA